MATPPQAHTIYVLLITDQVMAFGLKTAVNVMVDTLETNKQDIHFFKKGNGINSF